MRILIIVYYLKYINISLFYELEKSIIANTNKTSFYFSMIICEWLDRIRKEIVLENCSAPPIIFLHYHCLSKFTNLSDLRERMSPSTIYLRKSKGIFWVLEQMKEKGGKYKDVSNTALLKIWVWIIKSMNHGKNIYLLFL